MLSAMLAALGQPEGWQRFPWAGDPSLGLATLPLGW